MSTQSTRNFPSATETKCPDCGTTLSRRSDLQRHRNTQHPNGTEVKAQCPYDGCQYKTDQRSNLKAHIDARHSNESRYPCPDCGKGFTDPAARIRHRKTAHGYQPYHTPRYLAKRVFKAAEMKRAKAGLNKTRAQQAANVVPRSAQNASSSTDTLSNLVANATYHNDFWKLLVDVPRRDASELNVSQRVQIHAPIAVAPARDTPETLHSGSDLSLPMVGQQASTTQQRDGTYWLDPQFGTTMQPQSQALDQLWTAYGHQIPGVASDYHPFAATFPAPVTALNWSPF